MADLYGTTLAANAGKITTGVNLQGASLKFFEIDFGVAVNTADGSREVTWLVYNFCSEMGYTPVWIGTVGAPAYNQSGGAVGANQGLRVAIEVSGASVAAVDSAANHGYVWSETQTEPTVNYSVQGATPTSGAFSAALQAKLQAETAWPYVNDSGASTTINLSGAAVSVFSF